MRLILVYINPLPSCDDFSVSYRQALSLWKRLKTKFISAKKFKIIANVRERCQNLNTNSNIFFISWKISASQPASQPVSFTPTSQKQTNEARRWTLYERRVEKKLSRGRQGMAVREGGRERGEAAWLKTICWSFRSCLHSIAGELPDNTRAHNLVTHV